MKKNNKNSNHGINHWKLQRLSAVVIIPLVFWFVISLLFTMSSSYLQTIEWFMSPINSCLMIILFVGIFYHSAMGLQVVIEDYISNIRLRNIILNLSKIFLLILALISITSVLKIVFF